MRNRFKSLLAALDLSGPLDGAPKGLDMGSLRAGGANWLLGVSEDSELVRRRGRWTNSKIMEIYVQEVSSVQFLHKILQVARNKVLQVAALFSFLLDQACFLVQMKMPQKIWRSLLVGPALRMDELGKDGTVTQGLSGHDNVASLGGEKMDCVSCYIYIYIGFTYIYR